MTGNEAVRVRKAATIGAATIAIVALLGWALGRPRLTAIVPGTIAMNPATAVGLLLAAWALALLDSTGVQRRRIATVCALATAGIGVARLLALTFNAGPAVDLVLFRQSVLTAVPPNVMAPGTAAGLLFLGMALALAPSTRHRGIAHGLASLTALLALITTCSYLYASVGVVADLMTQPMALHTTLGLLLLAGGVMSTHPPDGVTSLVLRDSPGGALSRRLVPAAILLPILLGALRIFGEDMGLYEATWGVSLMAVTTVGLLVALILTTCRGVDRADAHRCAAEQQLRDYADEVSDLYDNAPCGYHSLDGIGVFQRINATELRWLGYQREEVVSKRSFADVLTAESATRFHVLQQALIQEGALDDCELEVRRKDGSTFHVLVSATIVRNPAGDYVTSRFTMFDITERKRAEAQIQQMNTALADRIQALDELNGELEAFSYSVSHDLRAPLRHVVGFAALLKQHAAAELDERALRYLNTLIGATHSMGQLIDDLLAFSRTSRTEMRLEAVDLNHLVARVRESLKSEMGTREIEWRVDSLPTAYGDEAMLHAAFTNLLANAVKYTRPQPNAVIHVGLAEATSEDEYHLVVKDNGVGFDMEYVERLFGVFQRLHHADEFEGTGIGLATVRRIVARHGGRTWAEGVVGVGATLHLTLPAKGAMSSHAA